MDDRVHEEILTIYRHSAAELRFVKQQTWQMVYYVALISSVFVVALPQVSTGIGQWLPLAGLGRLDHRPPAACTKLAGSLDHPIGLAWFPHSMFAQSGRVFGQWGHARLLGAVQAHVERHAD